MLLLVRVLYGETFASRQTPVGSPCCPAFELCYPAVGRLPCPFGRTTPKAHRAELEVLVTLGLANTVESPA